ncbi:MAG: dTDP-4-dehydrorhamnose 3,5-epimerase family protein [candidate division NC10 bacterium]|nr:dTDP-4-dehydrorhamnose 3,5-epimerase family protein [candidate division NC10 bacterium]
MKLIQGVATRQLSRIVDERGYLAELLRSDWDLFEQFGQLYLTTARPGVIKAWHMHRKQTDYFVCIQGMVKLVLCDTRQDSPTHRMVNEFFMGEENLLLVKIPPQVMHGFKAIGTSMAVMLNCPTEVYKYEAPDEYRLPYDTPEIPYDWAVKMG